MASGKGARRIFLGLYLLHERSFRLEQKLRRRTRLEAAIEFDFSTDLLSQA